MDTRLLTVKVSWNGSILWDRNNTDEDFLFYAKTHGTINIFPGYQGHHPLISHPPLVHYGPGNQQTNQPPELQLVFKAQLAQLQRTEHGPSTKHLLHIKKAPQHQNQ